MHPRGTCAVCRRSYALALVRNRPVVRRHGINGQPAGRSGPCPGAGHPPRREESETNTMPTYDWMHDVVDGLGATSPPVCRRCGQAIPDPVVAIQHAEPEREFTVAQRVRWYCSGACQTLGQDTP